MPSSLKTRLARYERLIATAKSESPAAHPATNIDPALEGLVKLDFPGGSIFCKDTIHPVEDPLGQYAIDWEFTSAAPEDLPGFLAEAAGTAPKNWAFIDCETTGLSSGVGTMAFLIAIGRPIKRGFQIRQFFLSELADERGLLEAIEESLAGVDVLWTYNGKCFDLPLLETRFRFWRMGFEKDRYGHVDLLLPTRVLFRRRIGGCSLSNLEEQVLKVTRVEDLPGAEVPQVYFEYLQTGRSPRLHRVFEHNRVDVLSLAVYASLLLNIFDSGREERLSYPEDVLCLARYYFRCREWGPAGRCLTDAKTFALGSALEAEYHRLSAYLHKRCGHHERACSHFRVLAGNPDADSVGALEEMAKHYEHRRREYRCALNLTDRAIALAERLLVFGGDGAPGGLAALHHRRARLQRKLTGRSVT